MRILPLALAALAAAACEGDPYVQVHSLEPYPLAPGDSAQLVARLAVDAIFFPFAARTEPIYDSSTHPDSFTWESSSTAVATVDARGMLHAVGVGQAGIRATARRVRSRPDTVTVVHAP